MHTHKTLPSKLGDSGDVGLNIYHPEDTSYINNKENTRKAMIKGNKIIFIGKYLSSYFIQNTEARLTLDYSMDIILSRWKYFWESTISLGKSKVNVFIRPFLSKTRFQPWMWFITSSFSTFFSSSALSLCQTDFLFV